MLLGKKPATLIVSIIVLVAVISPTAEAKSVYVISDTEDSNLAAYRIDGEEIEEQIDVKNLDDRDDAVGLALDPDSATMFVTYEGSNVIEMVNAKSMVSLQNPVTVTDATSLAGIAFDQGRKYLNKAIDYDIIIFNFKG